MKVFTSALLATATIMGATGASAQLITEDFESAPYSVSFTGNAGIATGQDYTAIGVTGSPSSLANSFVAFGGGNQPSGVAFGGFETVIGQTYDVAFDFGALASSNGLFDPLTVSGGLTSATFLRASRTSLDQAFGRLTFSFAATETSSTIAFTSGGVSNVDAVLDNVLVTAAPEPATWAMMIFGFGAVGVVMRRRKSKVTTNVSFA